jgi:hypothetical protein
MMNIMKNLNELQIKALKNENNGGMGWSFVTRVRKLISSIKHLKLHISFGQVVCIHIGLYR